MSEQRFLWVVRSPNDSVANASFFSLDSQKDPLDFLPKGFLDRTKGKGLVVPSWAPQAQVLSHNCHAPGYGMPHGRSVLSETLGP
ncbi:hypothetical protein Tsubulata_026377 [Turnera subulata]|uniref:Uncharacterized protein n=1 Tax=Turnera subulata TaxID=218843 RepID=A0A9Q0JE53_9ROSI|nr:hypothetical protein Tsubulata_026377 [Turnera subulata]